MVTHCSFTAVHGHARTATSVRATFTEFNGTKSLNISHETLVMIIVNVIFFFNPCSCWARTPYLQTGLGFIRLPAVCLSLDPAVKAITRCSTSG